MPEGHLACSSLLFSCGLLGAITSRQTCYGAIVTDAVMFQRSWASWCAGFIVTT